MYYRLGAFYKRDTYFYYNEQKNTIDWLQLTAGKLLIFNNPIIYDVDKIDAYIDQYDIIPSDPLPLVSKKIKDLFKDLEENGQIQFHKAIIYDNKKAENNNFYALNILNIVSCLDKDRSVFEIDEDGYYDIKKLFYVHNSLSQYSIVRMEEQESYIIVTEEFKKRCEDANLKGFNFTEEGHSIYTDL